MYNDVFDSLFGKNDNSVDGMREDEKENKFKHYLSNFDYTESSKNL